MQATIITIGDEILIGQIVDTNSVSIARRLNAAGIVVHEKCSIGDSREEIIAAIRRAELSSQVVIITGGLGPTKDDIIGLLEAVLDNYDEPEESEQVQELRQDIDDLYDGINQAIDELEDLEDIDELNGIIEDLRRL